ncbi:MAG: hypothetical protein Q9174_006045 [Haloplaca sp. 1 TL-2023]
MGGALPINVNDGADCHELQAPVKDVPSENDGLSNRSRIPSIAEVGSFVEYPVPEESSTSPASVFSQKTLGHGRLTLRRWNVLLKLITNPPENSSVALDGASSLDIASIIAVARFGAPVNAADGVLNAMDTSSQSMRECLNSGQTIYGVNTGFGGSADTHTNSVVKLQRNLIRFLNCGIIVPPPVKRRPTKKDRATDDTDAEYREMSDFGQSRYDEYQLASSTMPESWVRATMLIRSNSLATGNSGVRSDLAHSLVRLLNLNISPIIPLRGSISASGDLIPLSYIAATLQGSSEVEVWMGRRGDERDRRRLTANEALSQASLEHLELGPKEGLTMVNGTSVSAGVASLALHDVHGLISLSQVLTAMAVEALRGSVESFDAFFSEVRPHSGQTEVASNLRGFLQGSQLVANKVNDDDRGNSLHQDRYAIRTAPQWLGPLLEDLMLADKQVSVEINSTTDNPLVNTGQKILHGGNFQAMSVTSAMEKIRAVTTSIGRLLFAQCTELINPALSNGLPPNLTADEPSQSFLFKGIDICMASLQSELGVMSMPVTSHVQNAEMGNQSVNSLALLSSRCAHTALDVLSQMSAAYLLALCQALDLRAIQLKFLSSFYPKMESLATELFGPIGKGFEPMLQALWKEFKKAYDETTSLDSTQRYVRINHSLRSTIIDHAFQNSQDDPLLISALKEWSERLPTLASETSQATLVSYAVHPDATEYLGKASRAMYTFVRFQLKIPFETASREHRGMNVVDGDSRNLGALVSEIYGAIQKGTIYTPVMDCLREAMAVP